MKFESIFAEKRVDFTDKEEILDFTKGCDSCDCYSCDDCYGTSTPSGCECYGMGPSCEDR